MMIYHQSIFLLLLFHNVSILSVQARRPAVAFASTQQNASRLEGRAQEAGDSRKRRSLLGFFLLTSMNTPAALAMDKKEIKPSVAMDITGSPILASTFLLNHSSNKVGSDDRAMIQGIKADPTYLLVNNDKIESFALNAECTHLGCVVPWEPMQSKFVCPCHGSQYDSVGRVLRGPAPGPLKLAKVRVDDEAGGKVLLEPWTETDFRTGEKPWWI